MKKIYFYTLISGALSLASCAEDYVCNIDVEKPGSVAEAEQLAALDVLNSYVNRSANPNLKLGLVVNSADYASKGLTYSIAKTNFDAVMDNGALLYGNTVSDDGAVSLVNFTDMLLQDAPAVSAGAMVTYNSVNLPYLNSVIADNFVKGDLQTGKFTVADFDGDAIGTEYAMNNGSVATVVADPAGEEGNALMVGSPDNKARNSYPVFNISLKDGLTLGDCESVVFDIYCVDKNSQQKNLVMIADDARKNYTGDTPEKRGCPIGQWARRIVELKFSDVDKLTDADRAKSEFSLSFGPNVLNTYYYIDNVTIYWSTGEPDKYVEKTPAEKSQALADNFDAWAASVMEAVAPSVNEFVVVSNPMSDNPEFMLRSAESEEAADGCFFFNDYMGDNYVATLTKSFSKAYAANGGNGQAVLYVEESGLLGNADKTARLISQIKAWDAAGAQINGIMVDLPVSDATAKSEVADLFKALAATGKLIRLNNVSFGAASPEFCKFVVEEYLSTIAADKCAGIYFAGTGDLWKNNARSPVYGAIVDALK